MTYAAFTGTEEELDIIQDQYSDPSRSTWIPTQDRLFDIDQEQTEYFGQRTSDTTLVFDELFLLEIVAEGLNEQAFVTVANSIDWQKRSADDIIHAIQLAFITGSFLMARKLAELGTEQYPDRKDLKNYHNILAPPKIQVGEIGSDPTINLNREWITKNWNEYKGRWVALRAGQLLGEADTIKELIDIVGNPKEKGIFITRV